MATPDCPHPNNNCTPPGPLEPVFNNPEFCSETISDRCVIHTGAPLSNIGASTGARLDQILTVINDLILTGGNPDEPTVIHSSKEAALAAIVGADREEGVLIPVRGADNLVSFYWFQGGTGDENFVSYEALVFDPDALLYGGVSLQNDTVVNLIDTRWRIDGQIYMISAPASYNIPAPDAGGLLRIDNIIADNTGSLTYQTGVPSASAVAPEVQFGDILVATVYVSNSTQTDLEPEPIYAPDGGLLFGTGDPGPALGKEGNSYLNQNGGQLWKKEFVGTDVVWVLKYTPPVIGPLVAGRVALSRGVSTVGDDSGLLYDPVTRQLRVNTSLVNTNYKFMVEGGANIETGTLNMNQYDSVFNMSGGRTMIFANGFGMRFRLFNNDATDFPDTSKSFSWYNKGFEHMRLWSDATSLNGQGQPLTWEFRTRINYRLYLTDTQASTGTYKILTRNVSSGEIEFIDPIASGGVDPTAFIQNQTATSQTAGFNVTTKSKIDNISISRGPGTNVVSNTAIGRDPLFSNTDGTANTAIGSFPLYSNTTGSYNTALGITPLTSNTTGSGNTAMGAWTLYYNTIGTGNTAIGASAGVGTGTGSWPANGRTTVDVDNTYIGSQASRDVSVPQMTVLTNATAIGAYAKVGSSNALILGGQGSYVPRVGVGTINPNASSILDLSSITKGFLRPRMTTVERDAIPVPAEGLSIYNLTTKANEYYNGTVWISGGGTTVTAANGLNKTPLEVIKLGGTLTDGADIEVPTGVFLNISKTTGTNTALRVANTSTTAGHGIAATIVSTQGVGASISSTDGIGAQIGSSTSVGAQVSSGNNIAADIFSNSFSGAAKIHNNYSGGLAVLRPVLEISSLDSSGAAQIGMGSSIFWKNQLASWASQYNMGDIGYRWSNVGASTYTSYFQLRTVDNAVTKEVLKINGNGLVNLPQYGTGARTGTAVKNLSVTASGDVIETDVSTGGGLPTGGTAKQHLVKVDGVDFNTTWETHTDAYSFAVSDETTDLTIGASKISFRMPYAFILTSVRASLNSAPAGSNFIINIKEGGASIFSTNLSIDTGELTSTTATVPAVISDTALADDSLITVDIVQVGSTTAGKGLKISFIGYKP